MTSLVVTFGGSSATVSDWDCCASYRKRELLNRYTGYHLFRVFESLPMLAHNHLFLSHAHSRVRLFKNQVVAQMLMTRFLGKVSLAARSH
jgi:hypothetical protein